MNKVKLSRRSFILGGTACAVGAGVVASTGLSGCGIGKTKSGLDPKNFETEGVATLGTGFKENIVTTSSVPTKLYTITNKNGAELCVTNFGARIVSLMVPDKDKNLKNMVLGFKTIKEYATLESMPNNFYGAVVGRFGNRIKNGQFSLNGLTYQCNINEYPNLLHGGKMGWHFQTFDVEECDGKSKIKLKLVSPDGDMGFPGEVTLYVTYTLNDNNTLGIYYEATTAAPTVLNVTNHAYFNIAGNPNSPVTDQYLFIPSTSITQIDEQLIPTGAIQDVDEAGPFGFYFEGRANGNGIYGKQIGKSLKYYQLEDLFSKTSTEEQKAIAMSKINTSEDVQIKYGKGYDHNFCILRNDQLKGGYRFDGQFETANDDSESLTKKPRTSCKMYSEETGITMTIVSTEPGLQFYDGFDLDGTLEGIDGRKFTSYAGVALEPQHYPDWPNHSNFESNYLNPGEVFRSKTEYRFTV